MKKQYIKPNMEITDLQLEDLIVNSPYHPGNSGHSGDNGNHYGHEKGNGNKPGNGNGRHDVEDPGFDYKW